MAMNPADEINMLMEQLIAAWGFVAIDCDAKSCQVWRRNTGHKFEGSTLLEALRQAVKQALS